LLDLRGRSSGFLENLKALPGTSLRLKAELDNFAQITSLLDTLDCPYQIDITSTRGFEYYTGLCFQFLVNDQRIGGGGRYNDLIPLIGGPSTPACGFALYIDPLMNLVKSKAGQNIEHGVMVRCTGTTSKIIKSCFSLAKALRDIGYITEFEFGRQQAKWRWLVTMQQKKPYFIVTDQLHNETKEASSILHVVDIIGGSS